LAHDVAYYVEPAQKDLKRAAAVERATESQKPASQDAQQGTKLDKFDAWDPEPESAV
jgi:hypothetical protein